MKNDYCEKHEWPAGMGQDCPDCAELAAMTKHAKEGWDLANTRTGQWKAAELQKDDALKVLDKVARGARADGYIGQDGQLLKEVERVLAGVPEKRVGNSPKCDHSGLEVSGTGVRCAVCKSQLSGEAE